MNLEDRQAGTLVGAIDGDVAIEAAGAQQGRIEDVGAVGGGQHDHGFGLAEAIHLAEDLIERLFALVVAPAEAGAADAADGVDFVDEQNAGVSFLSGFEHIADAAGADADEHLNELGTADGEERHAGFASDGAGEQCFAGAWRAHQQHAFGDTAAEAGEFFGILEELDDFLQIVFDAFQAGDVGEGDGFFAGLFVALGGAFGKAGEDAAAAQELIARAAEHHPQEEEQQQRRGEVHEHRQNHVVGLGSELCRLLFSRAAWEKFAIVLERRWQRDGEILL